MNESAYLDGYCCLLYGAFTRPTRAKVYNYKVHNDTQTELTTMIYVITFFDFIVYTVYAIPTRDRGSAAPRALSHPHSFPEML